MTTRVLPEAEWPRLRETGMALAQVEPATSAGAVIVVEQDGAIVGCGLVCLCVHVEGVWIHPDFRERISVGRRLTRAVKAAVRRFGAVGACASTVGKAGERLIEACGGVELDGRHFVVNFSGVTE